MSLNFDWEAAIAEIDETIAMLQTTKEGMKYMQAKSGGNSMPQRVTSARDVAGNEFFGMGIPEAARKYLEMIRKPQTIGQIHEAVKSGGLPHVKYNAIYNAVSRREFPDGDFAREPGSDSLWGLAAWWPNNQSARKRAKATKSQEGEDTGGVDPESGEPITPPRKGGKRGPRGGLTIFNGVHQVLERAGKPIHADVIIERLEELGKKTSMKSMTGTLPQDVEKRFENLGGNMWALAKWDESIKAPYRKEKKEASLPLQ